MGIQSGIRKTPYIGASDLPVPRNVPDRLKGKTGCLAPGWGGNGQSPDKEKAPRNGAAFSLRWFGCARRLARHGAVDPSGYGDCQPPQHPGQHRKAQGGDCGGDDDYGHAACIL